jgi:hypothetical protein
MIGRFTINSCRQSLLRPNSRTHETTDLNPPFLTPSVQMPTLPRASHICNALAINPLSARVRLAIRPRSLIIDSSHTQSRPLNCFANILYHLYNTVRYVLTPLRIFIVRRGQSLACAWLSSCWLLARRLQRRSPIWSTFHCSRNCDGLTKRP